MPSINPATTKKKMTAAASVDQFEDADEEEADKSSKEETESFASAKEASTGDDDTEKKPSEEKPEAKDPPSNKKEPESSAAAADDDADGSDPATGSDTENEKEEEDVKKPSSSKPKKEPEEKRASKTIGGSINITDKTDNKKKKSSTPTDSPGSKVVEKTPATPPPASDASKKSGARSSPLDALASIACAEEKEKQKKARKDVKKNAVVPSGLGVAPKEGTRVTAEDICCTDVLCGRGGQSNHHPGNIFFRRLVRAKQEEYLKANKREKTVVAKDIVKLIRMLTPPGRFLKKDPKDESVYMDVGDTQARNKASQALREGAPELREELRDQHSRLNAERGGGAEVKLPYHGKFRTNESGMPEDAASREAQAAAAHHGMYLPAFAAADARAAAALRARTEGGKSDPPDGSEPNAEEGSDPARAAAIAHMAAEERARRLMFASMAGGQHGMGGHHLLHQHHMGFGGMGGMNPFLGGHSPAQMQAAAALQAAGGSRFGYPPAFMMGHHQPSAAAMFQASRARDLAGQIEAANYAAAAGINPRYLVEQQRGTPRHPLNDSIRLHDMMKANGNAATTGAGGSGNKGKREREEPEAQEVGGREAKAAKVGGED